MIGFSIQTQLTVSIALAEVLMLALQGLTELEHA
jgi:hypothetical protein